MKALLKNWLLPINCNSFLHKNKMGFLSILFFIFIKTNTAQIANYVNNGGFEDCINCYSSTQLLIAKYWSGIDTNKFFGFNLTALPPSGQVPNSSFTHQWPKSGNNYYLCTFFFKPNTSQTGRGYPRNRLKGTLQSGHSYCVKIYYNITNQSSYGIDGLGAYFGNNTLDTITQCDKPITYLTPQIQNPASNILSDTLNWSLLTGTFTANGSEKYMLLGNFKSDVATNSVMINPANLPLIATDFLFDDISVIDLNLPAYAGADVWGIPTTTVYLGRSQDVGIDEACMWYKLPNTTTAIDTAAGITITVAATTQTYMVKQDICGNIKYDTVVVYASALGNVELEMLNEKLKIYPNPASDVLNIECEILNESSTGSVTNFKILNSLGQVIKEDELVLKNNDATIKTNDLESGVYVLLLSSPHGGDKRGAFSKRFVIAR
jgi:hypothetical protein